MVSRLRGPWGASKRKGRIDSISLQEIAFGGAAQRGKASQHKHLGMATSGILFLLYLECACIMKA